MKASRLSILGRRFQIHVLAALFLLLVASFDLRSNALRPGSEERGQSKISVTTNLVLLPVSVTDSNGKFVSGLQRPNFRAYEDGRLQDVTLFAEEDTAVSVGLLVDHSRSMGPRLTEVATAVTAFADSSNPEDEMFVVDFSDTVSVESFGGKGFTSNAIELRKALLAVSARGQTALYDAVAEGLKHLELGAREKKALVIVSDGGDNASHRKYSDVLLLARQAHVVIYSIGLVGNSSEEENPQALERLCKDTGGIAFLLHRGDDISGIAKAIARDLREQYTLGYTPAQKIGGDSFRKIAVKVTVPGSRNVRVRTRTGYSVRRETASSEPGGGSR